MNLDNVTSLDGHVGNDSTVKVFDNGGAVVNFSVATTDSWKDKNGEWQKSTDWHNCTKNCKDSEVANKIAKSITKGRPIKLSGAIKYKNVPVTYKGKETVISQGYIKVNEFNMGKKATEQSNPEAE